MSSAEQEMLRIRGGHIWPPADWWHPTLGRKITFNRCAPGVGWAGQVVHNHSLRQAWLHHLNLRRTWHDHVCHGRMERAPNAKTRSAHNNQSGDHEKEPTYHTPHIDRYLCASAVIRCGAPASVRDRPHVSLPF